MSSGAVSYSVCAIFRPASANVSAVVGRDSWRSWPSRCVRQASVCCRWSERLYAATQPVDLTYVVGERVASLYANSPSRQSWRLEMTWRCSLSMSSTLVCRTKGFYGGSQCLWVDRHRFMPLWRPIVASVWRHWLLSRYVTRPWSFNS